MNLIYKESKKKGIIMLLEFRFILKKSELPLEYRKSIMSFIKENIKQCSPKLTNTSRSTQENSNKKKSKKVVF
jgi:hypothetical protein